MLRTSDWSIGSVGSTKVPRKSDFCLLCCASDFGSLADPTNIFRYYTRAQFCRQFIPIAEKKAKSKTVLKCKLKINMSILNTQNTVKVTSQLQRKRSKKMVDRCSLHV